MGEKKEGMGGGSKGGRGPPDRAVWVLALAGNIVLCSWARHFTLTTPLSTQVHTNGYQRIKCWG